MENNSTLVYVYLDRLTDNEKAIHTEEELEEIREDSLTVVEAFEGWSSVNELVEQGYFDDICKSVDIGTNLDISLIKVTCLDGGLTNKEFNDQLVNNLQVLVDSGSVILEETEEVLINVGYDETEQGIEKEKDTDNESYSETIE